MQITLELPDEFAAHFGQNTAGISRAALEALVADGVRTDKLSAAQARRILGFHTRLETESFLKSHAIELPMSIEQVRRDSEISLSFSK